MKHDFIIGIDPDAEKSGVAILKISDRSITLLTLKFPKLIEHLKSFYQNNQNIIVIVEAGWMVKKSNFHKIHGEVGENIAKKVGANHETGRKIIEMLQYYNIPVQEHFPLKKMWKGPEGKITHEEISKFINFPKQSNQEVRDSALLAWTYSGFPISFRIT